jgi:hypothetical protein
VREECACERRVWVRVWSVRASGACECACGAYVRAARVGARACGARARCVSAWVRIPIKYGKQNV